MSRNIPDDLKIDLVFDLINSFRFLKNPTQIADFLEDLLTPTEVRNLSVRLRIAKLLISGKSQREISEALYTSLVTTNKVSNWLRKSGKGFKEVISKLPYKVAKPTAIPRGPIEYHLPELIFASTELAISSGQENRSKKLIRGVSSK